MSLLPLMATISRLKRMIRWCTRVENSDIKKERSNRPPQKPLATISSRALESELAVLKQRASPESGRRRGSIETLLQTSDIIFTVRSRTSFCRREGKPPLGQEIQWSTVKSCPQAQEVGQASGVQW